MCAILAVIGEYVEKTLFDIALDRMEHRGPDRRGTWCNKSEDCRLGHRRLSIIDLTESGGQPMSSSNGRYWITFNGEVYNYLEIRETLLQKGYHFRSNCDTEVVVNAFQEWGEECQNMFNGMWAFVIYDIVENRCFVSRDRFGVKPLFYTKLNTGFVFASEMKSVIPFMRQVEVEESFFQHRNWDMSDYTNYESGSKCLIKGIHRVKAGSCAWIKCGEIEFKRWWNTLDHLVDAPKTYGEQCDYFRELFLDACRIRMRSDVTLGTCLSGGLDSSATICSMNHIVQNMRDRTVNKDFQHAFIAKFPGTSLDESDYADEVVDYLGIPKTDVVIDATEGLSHLKDEIYRFEELYITSTIPMMQIYRELRKSGVYVTLDGHGADELFGGYPSDVLYALFDEKPYSNEWRRIYSLYRSMVGLKGIHKQDLHNVFIYNRNVSLGNHIRYERDRIWDSDIRYGNRETLLRMNHFDRSLYNETHNSILPTLLRNYDRYSMASGVEIRMPFLDYRIVSFAFSITSRSKLNGNSKSIVRDSLRDIMPAKITDRKSKIGFSSPMKEWMQGELKEWFIDCVYSESFRTCPLVDNDDVRNTLYKVYSRDCNQDEAIFALMKFMPYLWYEYFFKKAINKTI